MDVLEKEYFTNCFYLDAVMPRQHNYEITLCKQEGEQTKMHSCLWVSCTAQAPSLDKLMTHICESHIGSGKVRL